MEHVLEKRFPLNSEDYKLYEEVGEGVSASVYRALCVPLNEIVAIKELGEDEEHRLCVKHLYGNWKKKYPGEILGTTG